MRVYISMETAIDARIILHLRRKWHLVPETPKPGPEVSAYSDSKKNNKTKSVRFIGILSSLLKSRVFYEELGPQDQHEAKSLDVEGC